MFNIEKDKTHDQSIKKTIVILILIILTILIITKVIVESTVISKASNDGWLSFIGSFAGGCIGGIGTLLAVYFTTKQTREMQQRNDRKNKAKEIENKVSIFIADITEYCNCRQNDKKLSTECRVLLKMELIQFQTNIAWKDMANKILLVMDSIYKESDRHYRDNMKSDIIKKEFNQKCNDLKSETIKFTNTYKNDGSEHY